MVDLSRIMQDAAILEVIDKSADEASNLSAQNSYQAMRIEELERELNEARRTAQYWKDEHLAGNAKLADLLAAKPDVAGLVERLQKQSVCIHIAAEPECAKDVSDGLRKAADALLSLSAQLAEKEAECEGMKADAERYRWLRKNGNSFYNCIHYQGVDEVLDANVDAAIAARKT